MHICISFSYWNILHILHILCTRLISLSFDVYSHYCLAPHPRAQLFTYHHLRPSPLFWLLSQEAPGKSADSLCLSKGIVPFSPNRDCFRCCKCKFLTKRSWESFCPLLQMQYFTFRSRSMVSPLTLDVSYLLPKSNYVLCVFVWGHQSCHKGSRVTEVVTPFHPILVQPQQWQHPAPIISEDEDGAELIVPDSQGGSSSGDKWVLPDTEIGCYARQYPEGPAEGWLCYVYDIMPIVLKYCSAMIHWVPSLQVYYIIHDITVLNLWHCLCYHRSMIS
jgi:hypothetical protein